MATPPSSRSTAPAGSLTFLAPPDYETAADANADNVYDLTVVVTDGALADSQDLTVTVTDVYENHAPVISSGGGSPTAAVGVVENTTAVTDIDATDPDRATPSPTRSPAAPTRPCSRSTRAAASSHSQPPPDYENPADTNTDNVYEVTVQVCDGTRDR